MDADNGTHATTNSSMEGGKSRSVGKNDSATARDADSNTSAATGSAANEDYSLSEGDVDTAVFDAPSEDVSTTIESKEVENDEAAAEKAVVDSYKTMLLKNSMVLEPPPASKNLSSSDEAWSDLFHRVEIAHKVNKSTVESVEPSSTGADMIMKDIPNILNKAMEAETLFKTTLIVVL